MYSAKTEFEGVLDLCAAELDAKDGGDRHRTALREGLTAIEEADDFVCDQSVTAGTLDVNRIASSHRTPLQQRLAEESMDSRAALQSYYEFAEQRLTDAYLGLPYATLPLYGLGRTSAALGEAFPNSALKSMLMHHLALQVNPANSLAANEMGVLLAHNGRYREAERVLRQGSDAHATAELWQNLAVVCERQGKLDESLAARQRGEALASAAVSKQPAPPVGQPAAAGPSLATRRSTFAKPATAHLAFKTKTPASTPAPITPTAPTNELTTPTGSEPTMAAASPSPSEAEAPPMIASKAPKRGFWDSIWK